MSRVFCFYIYFFSSVFIITKNRVLVNPFYKKISFYESNHRF